MNPKTVAVLGTCGHQDAVLDELAAAGGFSLVGIAPVTGDDRPENVRARSAFTRGARLFADPAALLAETRPDIAVVAPRFDRIAATAALAAEASCQIVSEKPLALALPDLDALWDTVAAAGVQCAAMLSNRRHPVLAAACAAIRAGAVGRVVLLNARKSYRWGERPEWYGDRARYGGTIPWIGIHALDFLHAAADRPFRSVSARHANLGHPDRPGCEDVCLIEAELEGGALASASLDYFRPGCAPTHGDDWLRVVGTDGVLEAAMDRGTCRILAPGYDESVPVPLPERTPTFADWLKALPPRGTRRPPDAETRRAFLLTRTALVAREAADCGRTLDVPPGKETTPRER